VNIIRNGEQTIVNTFGSITEITEQKMDPYSERIRGALGRIHLRINASVERAHLERKQMLSSARRSIGQKWRRAKVAK